MSFDEWSRSQKRFVIKARTEMIPIPNLLQPKEEAALIAEAKARGLSADALVREAMAEMFSQPPGVDDGSKQPTRSLRGLLTKYGPAPSAEEIDQNRAEMFANFPRADF